MFNGEPDSRKNNGLKTLHQLIPTFTVSTNTKKELCIDS